MSKSTVGNILEQPFDNVNPVIKSSPGENSRSMIHHNVSISPRTKVVVSYKSLRSRRYGVSKAQRVLSPQLLFKRFDYIRDALKIVCGLTCSEREVVLRLLRFWAYYGYVYPKASQICSEPGCSEATFWRTIRKLRSSGLIEVINRFVIRPHAQISNLYRLDRLIVLLAKYLAEHIGHLWPDWLDPWLHLTWPEFWRVNLEPPFLITGLLDAP